MTDPLVMSIARDASITVSVPWGVVLPWLLRTLKPSVALTLAGINFVLCSVGTIRNAMIRNAMAGIRQSLDPRQTAASETPAFAYLW